MKSKLDMFHMLVPSSIAMKYADTVYNKISLL